MTPAFALALTCLFVAAPDDGGFQSSVAPIFEKRCVSCHNAATPKGKFALDTKPGLLKGGESGVSVDAENPDESVLLEKIVGSKPSMPKSGAPLSAAEVEAVRRWIKAGTPWPAGRTLADRKFEGDAWWSLQPLKRPPVPTVAMSGWAKTPIDVFILQGLERAGMAPSPEADRRTLIRRLSFDLTGLPPTPEAVDAFLADKRPDAYELLVDRLLESNAYGERWARHWLDIAHYGDTHGYDKDKRRDNAWPYRDYVIDALNRDLPYARFIKEQIAGDVLYPDDPRGVVATGFLAAGPWDFVGHVELREGTVDKEKTRLIDRDDMVVNVVTTFDSLTVGCARCHDHKFDPIPQRDYYRLQAVFSGVDRGDRLYPGPEPDDRRAALELKRNEARRKLAEIDAEIERKAKPATADFDARSAKLSEKIEALPASSRRLDQPSPTNGFHSPIFPKSRSSAWVAVDLGASRPLDEIRLIPARPVDFADTPGFGFPRSYKVEASDDPSFVSPTVLKSEELADDAKAPDEPVVIRPRGAKARYLRVSADRLWKRTGDYVFALAELEAISGGVNTALGAPVTASGSIEGGRWSTKHLVDGFDSRNRRPSEEQSAERHRLLFERVELASRRLVAAREATGADLFARREQAAVGAASAEVELLALPQGPMVYAVKPIPPRPIRVLRRGEVEQPGEAVGPGALSCVNGLPAVFADSADEGSRRAALAEWITNPEHPLTWRSIVNRVWQYHVGRGIVDTPSDFGRNGSKPTHPELLDWLACEFRDGGGSLKRLHRLIATSAFYRQVSTDVPAHAAKDSDNRLLWRMNRRRLEAEAVRDAVLSVAGTLDPRRGGPAFEPFRFKDDHSPIYDHTAIERILAPENRRRSIYRFTVRSVPHPFLECLDSADPNTQTPTRSTTVTALQALALWNDPFMLAQADAFAKRCAADDPAEAAAKAVRIAFGREPRPEERRALGALARSHGLASVCRLLFNANEFIFVD